VNAKVRQRIGRTAAMTTIPRWHSQFAKRDADFPFQLAIHTLEDDFPAHHHDFLELSLVFHGRGTEVIDGVLHPMKPGTFTFVMPYQIHEIHVDSSAGVPLKLYNCNFGMELFWGLRDNFWINKFLLEADPDLPSIVQLDENMYAKMFNLLEEMRTEYLGKENVWRRELLFAKLIEVLVLFDRSRREQRGAESGDGGGHGRRWFRDILHYVHTHYRTDLTLADIASHFHISAPHLSSLFKKRLGQNFVEYLHRVRIRHACALLKSTDMTVSEIAFEVGYGSYSTFSRVFRELKGATPTDFRRMRG